MNIGSYQNYHIWQVCDADDAHRYNPGHPNYKTREQKMRKVLTLEDMETLAK